MDVKLVMFKADGQRKDIPLTESSTIIGRGEDCGLRVPLLAVSRHHCELSIDGDTLKVKDLGSSNGTYVNNDRINETLLVAGDRVSIGSVIFTVQIDGQPDEIAAIQAPESAAEEIVDLEADVMDKDATEEDAFLRMEDESDVEELDPIAALEALAAEKDDDEDK